MRTWWKLATAGAASLLVVGSLVVVLNRSGDDGGDKATRVVLEDANGESSASGGAGTAGEDGTGVSGPSADGSSGPASENGSPGQGAATGPKGSGATTATKPGNANLKLPGTGAPDKAPVPNYQAETDSLTAVANGLSLRNKSVTGVVEVAKGLAVTAPVEISVVYDGFNRISQNYSKENGNRIMFEWDALDGKARAQKVQVSLYERHPDGEYHAFQMPFNITIEPLYDVVIGQMNFELVTDCDAVGDSEPIVYWFEPDQSRHSKSLVMSAGHSVLIAEFSKAFNQIPVTSTLFKPSVAFQDDDNLLVDMFQQASFSGDSFSGTGSSAHPLLPGTTHLVQFDLDDQRGGDCGAFVKYDMFYNLHKFPKL